MTKLVVCRCLSALLLCCALFTQAADKLRLGYSDVENFPYQMGNGNVPANPPGFAVELLGEVARELGVPVEFVRMPAQRLLQDIGAGSLDGAFIFSYKEDRLAFGQYPMRAGKPDASRRITTINYVFYKLSRDTKLEWDGTSLRGHSLPIGINYTFSVGDDLKKMGLQVDDSGKSTAQNISKLQMGRIAAYATLEDSGDIFLQRSALPGITKLTPPITSRDYYLMFGKPFMEKQSALAERVWNKIGELRDKRGRALMEKYAD